MIAISAYLFDIASPHLLDLDPSQSDLSNVARRVSRTATLDGGCLIVDNGYSASDATFTIVPNDIDQAGRNALIDLVKTHSLIVVSTSDGAFLGVVSDVSESNKLKITFLVKSKLST